MVATGRCARSSGVRELNEYLVRLIPALSLFFVATCAASAGTVAETATKWGLIGRWSLDCKLPLDHDRGAVLSYEVGDSGRVMLHRDFGDGEDEAEVTAADISDDNLLNLRIYFPQLKLTRELGLKLEADGTIRAMYNRSRNGAYTIKDGKIMANGKPTPPQHRCGE